MGTHNTYSKRLKRQQQAGKTDVFQYDDLPRQFRVQVIHILVSTIGEWGLRDGFEERNIPNECWKLIHTVMCCEFGRFELSSRVNNLQDKCRYFMEEADTLQTLDFIECGFKVIDDVIRQIADDLARRGRSWRRQTPDDAIEDLNQRFAEHNLGYAFVGGRIIRKDSEFIHAEAVQPAFQLLADAQFSGPSEEFMSAHTHYRHGRHKEAIQDALKAFESTMKAICDARQWAYKPNDTAKQLIRVLLENELIPCSLQTHFNAFASVLESGLPTVRNKMAGHGQGATPVEVPPYFAAYALHLAAANIVLLVEVHGIEC